MTRTKKTGNGGKGATKPVKRGTAEKGTVRKHERWVPTEAPTRKKGGGTHSTGTRVDTGVKKK